MNLVEDMYKQDKSRANTRTIGKQKIEFTGWAYFYLLKFNEISQNNG